MSLAFHNYEDVHGHLPPAAVCGSDGKPLFSWRVLILPFIDQEKLFAEFHLNEPWDSEHNAKLLPRMPKSYSVHFQRYVTAPPDHTMLKVFVGPGTPFEPGKTVKLADDFPDGLENTFLFVEASDPVPWTKPDDIPFDPKQPVKLRGMFRTLFRGCTADTRYRYIPYDADPTAIRAAVTRNGGEGVLPPWAR
ncbi:MAG: DUF1559 domain-containing protein [Fimbriiglobus sp.]|nr:DUF1559 domain-containing protein [Fimbriiglobus sp.]